MNLYQKIILIFWLFMSLITFFSYALDKHAAKKGRWRTPERRLLLLAFFGGAPGALAGMYFCHHKIRKAKFYLTVPLFFLLQSFAVTYLFFRIA